MRYFLDAGYSKVYHYERKPLQGFDPPSKYVHRNSSDPKHSGQESSYKAQVVSISWEQRRAKACVERNEKLPRDELKSEWRNSGGEQLF